MHVTSATSLFSALERHVGFRRFINAWIIIIITCKQCCSFQDCSEIEIWTTKQKNQVMTKRSQTMPRQSLESYVLVQGWSNFWFHASIFSRLVQMRHTNIHFFQSCKMCGNMGIFWSYLNVYLFEKYIFILYNKHINKHYPIYLIMMTDVAVVDEQIPHNTF